MELNKMKADVKSLYYEALKKPTEGKPFLICIDVNLPLTGGDAPGYMSWMNDVKAIFEHNPEATKNNPSKEFCLVFTNFNQHYSGAEPAKPFEVIYTFPQWCNLVPKNEETYVALFQAFETYGRRPEGVF